MNSIIKNGFLIKYYELDKELPIFKRNFSEQLILAKNHNNTLTWNFSENEIWELSKINDIISFYKDNSIFKPTDIDINNEKSFNKI